MGGATAPGRVADWLLDGRPGAAGNPGRRRVIPEGAPRGRHKAARRAAGADGSARLGSAQRDTAQHALICLALPWLGSLWLVPAPDCTAPHGEVGRGARRPPLR